MHKMFGNQLNSYTNGQKNLIGKKKVWRIKLTVSSIETLITDVLIHILKQTFVVDFFKFGSCSKKFFELINQHHLVNHRLSIEFPYLEHLENTLEYYQYLVQFSKTAIEFIKSENNPSHWGLGFDLTECYDLVVSNGLLFSQFKLPEEIDSFDKIKDYITDVIAQVILRITNDQYIIIIHDECITLEYIVNEENFRCILCNVNNKQIRMYDIYSETYQNIPESKHILKTN